MILLPLALALLSSTSPPQDPVQAETPAQALDALIERTNALDSFLARWSMHKGDAEVAHITLRYQAPDRMRLDMVSGGGEDEQVPSTSTSSWVAGTRMGVRAERGDGERAGGEIDYAALPGPIAAASYELDARFPPTVRALGPGCSLDIRWGVDEATDKAEFDVQLGYSGGDRTSLFQWLRHLRVEAETCELDGEQLSWHRSDDRIWVRLSLRTGFLEALDMVGKEGERMELRLEQLDLAPELDPQVFEIPPPSEGSQDLFPDGGAGLLGGPGPVRRAIFARVSSAVEDGRRAWDESTREDARAVLMILHTGLLSAGRAAMAEQVSPRIADFVSWMRDEQAKAPPGDRMVEQKLREAASEWRDGFERSIDGELPRLLASLEEPPEALGPHVPELVALERGLVGEAYEQLVRAPLLALLDERVAEALDD